MKSDTNFVLIHDHFGQIEFLEFQRIEDALEEYENLEACHLIRLFAVCEVRVEMRAHIHES